MWLVVVCFFFFRIMFTVAHYYLVAAFVRSKPPGRKMVWMLASEFIYDCVQHRYCILGYLRYQCVCMLLQRYRKGKICINTFNKLHHCYLQRIEGNTISYVCKKKIFQDYPSAISVVSAHFILFSIFGNLPSTLIFLLLQMYKTFGVLFIGVLNVSALLQVVIITNQGWE